MPDGPTPPQSSPDAPGRPVEVDSAAPGITRLERLGRFATYVWLLAAAIVFVQWLRDPSVFTQEAMADLMQRWGNWAFGSFIAITLLRGIFLVPSTPIILAGGVLFPDALPAVLAISLVGIVLSATVIYLMPGFGGYDHLLERKYPDKIARVRVHLVKPHAFWVVAGWSFFPLVPTDVICYVAGLVHMSYKRMMFALLLGEVPLVVGYLLLAGRVQSLLG